MEFKKCSIGSYSYGTDSEFSVMADDGSFFNDGVTNVNFNDEVFEQHW